MTSALRAISSMATRQLLGELLAAWRDASGVTVNLESVGGVDAALVLRVDGMKTACGGGQVFVQRDLAVAIGDPELSGLRSRLGERLLHRVAGQSSGAFEQGVDHGVPSAASSSGATSGAARGVAGAVGAGAAPRRK